MKVEKGCLVKLEYKTIVDGNVVDSSEIHKPIEVVYGHTSISKELADKIKGKEKGFEFELKQTVNSKPVRSEFSYGSFDEDTVELMKKNKEIELEVNKFWYPFKVIDVDEEKDRIILEYEDPFKGKSVLHKIKILDVHKLDLKEVIKHEKTDEEDSETDFE